MQKLVSRNPVQRFKEGRKIVKAEDGWRLIGGKAYKLNMSPNVKQSPYHLRQPTLTQRYVLNGRQYGSFDGGKTYYSLTTGNPLDAKNNQNLLKAIARRNSTKQQSLKQQTDVDQSTPARPTINWNSRYNNFVSGLTDEQKQFLAYY